MAHIAIIFKDTNEVIGVTPVANDKMQIEGVDNLELAKAHLIKCFSTNDYKDGLKDFKRKEDGLMYQLNEVDFVQTSYHENIHYNYAGVGDTWSRLDGAFIKPKPPVPLEDNSNLTKTQLALKATGLKIYKQGDWVLNPVFKWEFSTGNALMRIANSTSYSVQKTAQRIVRLFVKTNTIATGKTVVVKKKRSISWKLLLALALTISIATALFIIFK